jgi:type I restriction enzyme R subunit
MSAIASKVSNEPQRTAEDGDDRKWHWDRSTRGFERPLLNQLTGMGWRHVEGAPPAAFLPTDPAASGRESFSEVFLTGQLRQAIYRLNRGLAGYPAFERTAAELDARIGFLLPVLDRAGAAGPQRAGRAKSIKSG